MIEIDIDFVRPGDKIAKNYQFKNFEGGFTTSVDLRIGATLTPNLIKKLKDIYNVRTLAIDDKEGDASIIGHGIEINSDDTRKIVNDLTVNLNSLTEDSTLDLSIYKETLRKIIDSMIDMINKNEYKYFSALTDVVGKLDSHNSYTYTHSVSVAIYSLILALTMPEVIGEFKDKEKALKTATLHEVFEIIGINMLLHDIGKLQIKSEILDKPSKLNDMEFEQVKSHPRKGWDMMHEINKANIKAEMSLIPSTYMIACLYHHQSYDGTGYPAVRVNDGDSRPLKGREIPLIARIAAVADIFDALTSKRPYRKKIHALDAIKILQAERGKKLDPILVDKFIEVINIFPVGSTVKLTDDSLALVVGYNHGNKYEPILKPYMKKIAGENVKITGQPNIIIGESKLKIVIDEQVYEKPFG